MDVPNHHFWLLPWETDLSNHYESRSPPDIFVKYTISNRKIQNVLKDVTTFLDLFWMEPFYLGLGPRRPGPCLCFADDIVLSCVK